MAAKRTGLKKPSAPVASELRATLATNLRTARLASGLTLLRLSELANVSKDYIRRIEARDANVSIDILAAIAVHVGKTPLELAFPFVAEVQGADVPASPLRVSVSYPGAAGPVSVISVSYVALPLACGSHVLL